MNKKRVLIVCGGPQNSNFSGKEYHISLLSAKKVYDDIDQKKFDPVIGLITPEGRWFLLIQNPAYPEDITKWDTKHFNHAGDKNDFITQEIDIVFNALHGAYGEGGEFQEYLDSLGVKYTGSSAKACRLAFDKIIANDYLRGLVGIPRYVSSPISQEKLRSFLTSITSDKVILKLPLEGSSFGIKVVNATLADIGLELVKFGKQRVLIQEYVPGVEVTCPVIGFGSGAKALPVMQIEYNSDAGIFDYNAKYDEQTTKEFVSTLPVKILEKVQELSISIHRNFGCSGVTRHDFIIDMNQSIEHIINYLESNIIPGEGEVSIVPKAIKAAGWHMTPFITYMIELVV